MLRVNTFGRLHVRSETGIVSGSAAQPRRLAILALLAAAGDQGLTRDKVLAYLWTDTEEERARRGLNQALYALRQDLGSDDVFLGNRDLRLNPELVSSDVEEFEQALERGRLEEAAARYSGSFLDGFHLPGASEFERWAEEERAELAHRYAHSLEKLAKWSEEQRDWGGAVSWWRKLAAQDRVVYRMHAMGTSLQGSTEDILGLVGELHATPFEQGIPRVYTVLKLDERRDKPDQTLEDKVASVEARLQDA